MWIIFFLSNNTSEQGRLDNSLLISFDWKVCASLSPMMLGGTQWFPNIDTFHILMKIKHDQSDKTATVLHVANYIFWNYLEIIFIYLW